MSVLFSNQDLFIASSLSSKRVIQDQHSSLYWNMLSSSWVNRLEATIFQHPFDAHTECEVIFKLDNGHSRQLSVLVDTVN